MATTTIDALDALLYIRNGSFVARWNFPDAIGSSTAALAGIGNSVTISYSFPNLAPTYASISGFLAFSNEQKQAAREVLESIEEIANIRFIETTGIGQITFANSSQPAGTGGYAYTPSYSYTYSGSTILSVTELGMGGDVWINRNATWTSGDWSTGHDGYATLLHEIGHALGLKHPFEASSNGYFLDASLDNERHTVMSYTNAPKSTLLAVTGTATSYSWQTSYLHPSTLMPLDIEAIQHLYGKNLTTRSGNDTYRWGLNPEVLETIWDTGGNDTIDCSNQTLTCIIDLQDGSYSSISLRQTDAEKRLGLDLPSWFTSTLPSSLYDGSNNIAIAKGSIIEHAMGGSAADRIFGNAAGNALTGGAGNDTILGHAGNDTLDGGTGNDAMSGNSGNDYYHLRDTGDVVTEAAAEGKDTVYSYLSSHTLGANIENGRIMSTGTANLTGNTLSNLLYAGKGNNLINGGSGTDIVSYYHGNNGTGVTVSLASTAAQATGGSGTDTLASIERLYGTNYADKLIGNTSANVLKGYKGNDTLDGGTGNDTMVGNAGNDYYYLRDTGDVVTEAPAEGTDTVYSYLSSHTLGENIENGRIMSSGTANLSGNTLSNLLYAGKGNNLINGGSGTDIVSYYHGNNGTGVTVSLASTAAQATGGSGTDTLASIERLYGTNYADKLTGNTSANVLKGYNGDDTLTGGSGNDTLYGDGNSDLLQGGTGNDILYGGAGNDLFRFDTALNATSNIDQIKDFSPTDDTIQLENSIFTWSGTTGTIGSAYFRAITTGQATDNNDYIVYDKTTGAVKYDADGGADGHSDAIQFATIGTNLAITYADFMLV